MTDSNSKKPRPIWALFAILLFVAAGIMRFALIGYAFSSYLLAGAGMLILIYKLLTHFKAKKLRIALTVLVCAGALLFIAASVPVIRAATDKTDVNADYIIVLGAGVNGSTPSLSMINRLDAALAYLQEHPECTAVVSGGQGPGEDMTEARAMYIWLTAKGIAPERIILEERSTNTEENLSYSFELIGDGVRDSDIAVVSSEYHLCRAKYIARTLGVEVGGVAGHTTLPFLMINYFIRETFGMAYMWAASLFG